MRQRAGRRNGRVRIALIASAAMLMSLVGVGLAGPAAAATTRIAGSCAGATDATINDAVSHAADGDTIQICPGTYTENVMDLGRSLNFRGPQADVDPQGPPNALGEAIITGDPTAFDLLGASTVNGVTIKNTILAVKAGADGITIKDTIIDNAAAGVAVEGSNILISHNSVQASSRGVEWSSGLGTSGVEISDNSFQGALGFGAIDAEASADHLMTNLAVLRNAYALETGGGGFLSASESTGLRVEGNVLDGEGAAVKLISLGESDHDWSVKANKFLNGGAEGVSVTCAFDQTDPHGSVIQNLFRGVKTPLHWLATGPDCSGTFEVHSNMFVAGDGTADPANAAVADNAGVTVNVENNFWGCNAGPTQPGCNGNVGGSGADRWLLLKSTIGTKTLSVGQTTPFIANLNHNNLGETVALPVLDGSPISFTASTYLTVTPTSGHLTGGIATATVKAKQTPGGKGIGGQSVTAHVANAASTQSPITVRPSPPVLSIAGATTAEGRTGTHVVYFAVRLSHKFDRVVTVKFATANGTAKAPADFVAKAGTLSIPVGATTGRVGITVKGDKIVEPNESFFVTFFSPVNATVADPNAIGVIRNS